MSGVLLEGIGQLPVRLVSWDTEMGRKWRVQVIDPATEQVISASGILGRVQAEIVLAALAGRVGA